MKFLIAFEFILPGAWIPLPDSVGLQTGRPFFVPGEEGAIVSFPAIAVRIDRLGKCIETRFAHRYWREAAPALISMPAGSAQRLNNGILPASSDICFDSAIITGHWTQTRSPEFTFSPSGIVIALDPETVDETLSRLSQLNTLKTGDIIIFPAKTPFTPVADTVVTAFPVHDGEHILLRTKIK